MTISRRELLAPMLALPVLSIETPSLRAQDNKLALTPQCAEGASLTVSSTEGPFFRPNSPLRHDLTTDLGGGERILLSGYVLDRSCKPVVGALIELWQADGAGRYDNEGHVLRGHHFSDAHGMWWFLTIMPASYPGRTPHYHVKVQRPSGGILTTQLYHPDEPLNARDQLFDPRLVMQVTNEPERRLGRFDFIV